MTELDRHPLERQRLALGVEPKRHGRAGSQPREHEIVGTRAAVEPPDVDRFVSQEAMRANRDRLLEAALMGFANDDGVGIVRRLGRELRHVEITFGPGANDVGDVGRVAAAAQKVIRAGERDEAFGMLRRGEDAACIVDRNDLIGRRVEDQQCLAQVGDAIEELMLGEVVDETAADAKLPTREGRLDLTLGADLVETILEQAGHVGGIAGCGDRHHRARLRPSAAAASTAVPPRLWPMRIAGAAARRRSSFAAATRSAILEENVVLANSPSLEPRPVKSKRSTAMPSAVKPSAIRLAAWMSLPQVKQCANSA